MTMILITFGVSSAIMFGLFFIVPIMDRQAGAPESTAERTSRAASTTPSRQEEAGAH